ATLEIIRLRQQHPTWGAKKIRKLLSKRLPLETQLPSVRTITRILGRLHLLRPKKRRRRPTDQGWMLQTPRKAVVVDAPNDVWTVDFKGWWKARDGRRCEPLTVRDAVSRYVLAIRILPRSDTDGVRAVFEELFERHGLPKVKVSEKIPCPHDRAAYLHALNLTELRRQRGFVRGRPYRQRRGRSRRD